MEFKEKLMLVFGIFLFIAWCTATPIILIFNEYMWFVYMLQGISVIVVILLVFYVRSELKKEKSGGNNEQN